MNGFEVLEELKRTYGISVKLIVLSGYEYDEYVHKAFEIGVHA